MGYIHINAADWGVKQSVFVAHLFRRRIYMNNRFARVFNSFVLDHMISGIAMGGLSVISNTQLELPER